MFKTQGSIYAHNDKQLNPNPHGGGVLSIPLEVFLALFFKDINHVPQNYLTFTNYLLATFSLKNFQSIELIGHVTCPYLEAGSKQIIVFDDFNGKV